MTAYQSSTVQSGSSCVSETRTCNNGTLSGSYTNAACTVAVQNIAEPTYASFLELAKTPFFHSYYFAPKIVDEIRDTGTHVYSIDTNLFGDDTGFTQPVGTGPGEWDFSPLTDTMAMILREDPQAKFMVRPYAGTPQWWDDLAPGCLERHEDGSTGSQNIASGVCPNVRTLWALGIQQLDAALTAKGYKNLVVALTLTGESSQEWINFDNGFNVWSNFTPLAYGTADKADYANWASAKGWQTNVPTEAQFRAASFIGGASRSTFLDPGANNDVLHYYLYRSHATAETITFLAQKLRATFPGRAIGVIYGYMNEFSGNPTAGHNALSEIIASPYIDFINPMPSYQDRVVGGADMERQPITSLAVHNKLIFNDWDLGTSISKQNYDALCEQYHSSSDPHLQAVYVTSCTGDTYLRAMIGLFGSNGAGGFVQPSLYSDVSNLRRWLGYTIARNMDFSYLSLHNDPVQSKSNLSDATLLGVVSQINTVKARAANQDLSSIAQVLVVTDEDSNAFVRYGYGDITEHSLGKPLIALNKMGAPYDHVLLRDLAYVNPANYRLVIFLNAWSVDATMRSIIAQKFKNSGRVLMFNYADGMFDSASGSEANMQDFTGIKIVNSHTKKNPVIDVPTSPDSWFKQAYDVRPSFSTAPDFLIGATGTQIGWDDDGYATAVYAAQDGWTSLWFESVDLPPGVFRDIARGAGVHIYSETNDPLYANKSFLTLVAGSGGHKKIVFPSPVTVHELISDQVLQANTTSYEYDAGLGDVHLLRIER
ncbi:MAG: hypothetical protein JWM46_36 [Candidatus Kaiserbacteria bacterium]|nr:hypothetical protein [Candidatus Kaiserbacteria bacterium]